MEFRLLVPDYSDQESSPQRGPIASRSESSNHVLTLAGRNWKLSDPWDIEDKFLPKYVCISYLWGPYREPHALFSDHEMSTHTLPSLASAMKLREQCEAFWTDVFCVPAAEGPARQATLEGMGYIYSRATEVVAVLGGETFSVVQDMVENQVISELHLDILERDGWISSVWTYQETTNSVSLSFVSEIRIEEPTGNIADTATPVSIDITDFFSALGYGLMKYQQGSNSDPFAVIRAFPNLNELENILADWHVSSFARRSVYSVLSGICAKRTVYTENYFYACFGALTSDPQQLTWTSDQPDHNLAQKLMHICESKNDYSFIYTVAERDQNPLRRWRPRAHSLPENGERVPAIIQPLFVWHSWGEAQEGHIDENGALWLHDMTIVTSVGVASMSDVARRAIITWLGRSDLLEANIADAALATTTYTTIQSVGFRGQGPAITVPNGLIFPHKPVQQAHVLRVILSNQIRFAAGAPGLIHLINDTNEKEYVPCVFIGAVFQLIEEGETVLL